MQRDAGYQFSVFYEHCVPDEPPFSSLLSSISETVEALNYQLECGRATASNFTKHSERYFSPSKITLAE